MKFSVLRGNRLTRNIIFNTASSANRDNCFAPYALLREKLYAMGIQIDTVDEAIGTNFAFELHQDVQHETTASINYLLMLETVYVKKENWNPSEWRKYKKIFTWDQSLVDNDRFVKLNLPNLIHIHPVDGFSTRDRFCCLISGNKTLSTHEERSLYPERVSAIRWFESHAPQDFDLYGVDWDIPEVHSGIVGKFERRFWRMLSRFVTLRPFSSYRGKLAHKRDALIKTRFAICYENVRDLPGYITEKIFDCFFAGCIPVYWGASNIADHVPADCFIDRRKFNTTEEVYKFLKNITEHEFKKYQQRIANFLQSEAAYPFSSECFAETIVNTIAQDIGS